MALHVHAPIRVRLVGAVTPHELSLLERSVGDATRTALLTARREVLDARGTNRRIVLDRPAVAFCGLPTTAGERERAAEAVARGVTFGLSSSGLLRPRRHAGARVAGRTEEPFDASRADGGGTRRSYRVPSYDQAGTEVPVPLVDEETAAPSTPRRTAARTVRAEEALQLAWEAYVARSGAVWPPGADGYPGYAGSVLVNGRVQRMLVWVTEVRAIQEDGSVLPEDIDGKYQPFAFVEVYEAGSGRSEFRARSLEAELSTAVLLGGDEPATVEAIERTVQEFLAGEHAPDNAPLRDPVTRRRYAEWMMREVPAHYVIRRIQGRQRFAVVDPATESPIRFVTAAPTADVPETGPVQEPEAGPEPPSEELDTARGGEGPGGRPGAGPTPYGAPVGGPLGGREDGPRDGRWPTGLTGEPLNCAPYGGEPSLHDLPHGRDRLAADIRRIARLLDVPECPFPGRFALNCARAIAARARGVGLASVTSGVTTDVTVRSDGRGNNGFLDLRPGQAPELQYLRLLAEITGLVSRLSSDITSAYAHPDNAGLVRREADSPTADASSWIFRFVVEMFEELSTACTHLFAETCRVLLLQQLRSSRAAIAQRRGERAEETLEHFDRVLDVLGGSVVKLIVLRRAVRHAERLGATGTLREVLSRRELRYRAGYHESLYEAPAPIESVSSRTLADLADARIERQGTCYVAVSGGRSWSVSDLDAGINARRALVNQVDPLFLQIGDLEDLFRTAQTDPGHTGAFLADLLTQMAKANSEMTAKASEPDDGAFFALETSQWVEVQGGGKDRRGLWFELHGIHQMADDQLRPYVGDPPEYIAGVNRAIMRKAGLDQLLQVFATAGIVVLGLLCAPLGAAVAGLVTGAASIALATRDFLAAQEKEELYRSLEDPEALLRWQDVETEKLLAAIGIAFSVFDLAHVAGGARAIARDAAQVWRAGRQLGGEAAMSAARQLLVRNMTEQMLRHALAQAVTEYAVMQAMEVIVPRVVAPVLGPWIREQALQHGTLSEVDADLRLLAGEQPELSPAPPAAAPPKEQR
ncbi:hypothetical protein [Streptomyces rhizosphaericus]|uniref:Uncharacterized protein n=1 Tax=Streptomyces rhizosphaericus TaxID=114699 RepID=A0A6G4A9J3_9ACTN|nr:hypothetical protein [Streptomyces rhizosphaericus]NEW69878.1 hypothetical protein [Streptomyces rhizosphaericus]